MTIQLDSKQKSELTHTLQKYLQDELDVDLGQFDTEFLVDFISKKVWCGVLQQGNRRCSESHGTKNVRYLR